MNTQGTRAPRKARQKVTPSPRRIRAQTVTLASYTIRVRPKRSADYKRLGAFNGTASFYDFAHSFLEALSRQSARDERAMSLQRAANVDSDGESVWGVLEGGDYGFASELVNVTTMKRSYRRETDDAELIPFYFILDAPPETDKALLILQRYGNRGVLTEFTNALRVAFENSYPDFLLDIRRHVPRAVIEMLRKGQVKTLQLTRYSLSDDLADKIRWKGRRDTVKEVVITIKAETKGTLARPDWLDRALKKEGNVLEMPSSMADVADRVRVAVTYNGKQRFVDFEDEGRIAPYIDVTHDIKLSSNGHPEFQSIHKIAQQLLFDLMAEIGRPA